MLSNYKTYIVAVSLGLATAAHSLGWITQETYDLLLGLLGAGGLAALRHGISSSSK